uniref:Putative secreted peptide n=1 Tax=Anopheles braziliensis TaxID=58242 RepID=A0A2M3ZNN3_9DIPT
MMMVMLLLLLLLLMGFHEWRHNGRFHRGQLQTDLWSNVRLHLIEDRRFTTEDGEGRFRGFAVFVLERENTRSR